MARTSLRDVRIGEILDAYMVCIGRYGVIGTTLERISKESGLARPLLRHYLGNRNEMFAKLLTYVVATFDATTDELIAGLPETGRLDAMLDTLFDTSDPSSDHAGAFQALVSVAPLYEGVGEQLMRHMTDFENAIAAEIAREIPTADVASCKVAAAGIAATCYNVEAVLPLDPPTDWVELQRRVAEKLIEGLR